MFAFLIVWSNLFPHSPSNNANKHMSFYCIPLYSLSCMDKQIMLFFLFFFAKWTKVETKKNEWRNSTEAMLKKDWTFTVEMTNGPTKINGNRYPDTWKTKIKTKHRRNWCEGKDKKGINAKRLNGIIVSHLNCITSVVSIVAQWTYSNAMISMDFDIHHRFHRRFTHTFNARLCDTRTNIPNDRVRVRLCELYVFFSSLTHILHAHTECISTLFRSGMPLS